MKKHAAFLILATALASLFASKALSHCQIPCGIYGDDARFTAIEEHITTITKSMNKIQELSKADAVDQNQVVRWVTNKEVHADAISEIVTAYFMAQRIKPADGPDRDAYVAKLTVLHQMLVAAMKCKQTTDVGNAAKLHNLLHQFQGLYTQAAAPAKKK